MTYNPPHTYGKPPEYPTDQMVPKEFWRKETDGIADNPQVITIETPNGPVKREVERGWEVPVYLGPTEDDEDEE